jgi:DNA-binding beta-propeller fold protein YncE
MNPKFLHHIDSGGANPTRVRILQGGGLVAATGKGIYSGNANGRMSSTGVEGPVVAMLDDPQEGQFVTVVLQAPPRVAVFGREGPPRVVNLKENPKTAARAGAKIYIVNYGSDSLSALDPRYPDKITPILLKPGAAPFDLAQRPQSSRNPDEIYVTETKLQQIAVVDPSKDAAVEFPAPIANATLVAFSPNGCVAVVYDPNKQALAKIDPKRRVVFDSIQYLPAVIQPPPVALRVDSALRVSLVLEGGTIMTPYQASCPR